MSHPIPMPDATIDTSRVQACGGGIQVAGRVNAIVNLQAMDHASAWLGSTHDAQLPMAQ